MSPSHSPADDLRGRVRKLQTEAGELRNSARGMVATVRDSLQMNMFMRPYITLAVVAGVGYLLGGGLTPRLARSLVAAGLHVATGTIANEVIGVATNTNSVTTH